MTIPGDYAITFDALSKWDKLQVVLGLPGFTHGSERVKKIEQTLAESGFDVHMELDEETFAIRPTDAVHCGFLIQELEVNTFSENVEKLRKSFDRLRPILTNLKPVLALR